jgi:hypothetical protein
MADEEQELTEKAQKSRHETQELREESGLDRESDPERESTPDRDESLDSPPEPWAKTSSGDKENVTDDDA